MGRPRKYTPDELIIAWDAYKNRCNNMTALTHDFSSKNSEFVSAPLKRSVTYTIEGFCVFLDLSRSAFYEYFLSLRDFLCEQNIMKPPNYKN